MVRLIILLWVSLSVMYTAVYTAKGFAFFGVFRSVNLDFRI